jgi:S1-C subfamily serine protease
MESTAVQSSYEHRNSGALYLIGALVAAVVGSLLTVGMLALTGTFDDSPVPVSSTPVTVIETGLEPTTPQEPSTQIINGLGSDVNETAIAAKVIPSIVTVNVLQTSTDDEGNDTETPTGSGSGVVQSTDGYIITNHHVIDGGDAFSVTFEDGRAYEATLVGSDEYTDLAVLQINADGLVPIEFGSSDALAVGDPAVAVGNPLGQAGGSSITSGIISAFNRRVGFADSSALFGMIQTDAAINSGSSGGALVDAEGKLIGITSAIGVSTAGPEGIGYAIPIELVDRITAEIIETGDVEHPFMGVQMQTFFDEATDGAIIPAGAIIGEITEVEGFPSSAGAAGMQVDDIVVAIEGEPITSQDDLILKVRLYRVGDTITFTVDRAGDEIGLSVTLGHRPPQFLG